MLKTAALGLSCPSVRALSLYGAEPDPLLKVNNDSPQLVCRARAGERVTETFAAEKERV